MTDLVVKTTINKDVRDITEDVQKNIQNSDVQAILLTVLHTTAALTTADLDPGTDQDLLDFLDGIIPDVEWRHPHNPAHTPAHLLSSLIGSSITVPVREGRLKLGTWQRIILVELDGPREREISLTQIT